MTENHKKRLIASAKEIQNRPKNREQTIATFSAAGILTKSGNFTKPYANLRQALAIGAATATAK